MINRGFDGGLSANCLVRRAEHEESLVEGSRVTLTNGYVNSMLLRLPAVTDAGLFSVSDVSILPRLFLRIASAGAETKKLTEFSRVYLNEDLSRS